MNKRAVTVIYGGRHVIKPTKQNEMVFFIATVVYWLTLKDDSVAVSWEAWALLSDLIQLLQPRKDAKQRRTPIDL